MAQHDHLDRVWDIIARVGVCMLTTRAATGLRARPLEARPDRDAGIIWFVTDRRSGKEHEIERETDVGLVFTDAKSKAYLSITAQAEVSDDHTKAAKIWKTTDNAWWSGPRDRNVCVLRVTPITAELWDGPASKAVAIFEFAKSRLTDRCEAKSGREPQSLSTDATAASQATDAVGGAARRATGQSLRLRASACAGAAPACAGAAH
jgi:general stress protein 26